MKLFYAVFSYNQMQDAGCDVKPQLQTSFL